MCEQEGLKPDLRATGNQTQNDAVNEQPIRGTRAITEIYQRCNLAKL